MNELADRIVALGVGFAMEFTEGRRYTMTLNREYLDADSWVRDGRVVLAMIVLVDGIDWDKDSELAIAYKNGAYYAYNKEPAIAVLTACCDALEND